MTFAGITSLVLINYVTNESDNFSRLQPAPTSQQQQLSNATRWWDETVRPFIAHLFVQHFAAATETEAAADDKSIQPKLQCLQGILVGGL